MSAGRVSLGRLFALSQTLDCFVASLKPLFLPIGSGYRFCIFHKARVERAKGAVLYVHPFAEEMNKARRMAALQSRMLVEAGYDVLQIDLFGCGDSSGDFGDATWEIWLSDVLEGCRYLLEVSSARLTIWGTRAACLLLAQIAARLTPPVDLLFWQPVISGRQHWQQFMRLKTASEILAGEERGKSRDLRRQLVDDGSVEIAGYVVASSLVSRLESAQLVPSCNGSGRLIWLETSTRSGTGFSPNALKTISLWESAGYTVDSRIVEGPTFWQSVETEVAPELIRATLACMDARR